MTSVPSPSDASPEAPAETAPGIAFRPAFVILSSLVFFTVFWYFGRKAFYHQHLNGAFPETELTPLYPFFFFCVMSVVYRTVLPILCVKLVLRRPLSEFGYGFRGTWQGAWIYGALFVAVVPFIVLAASTAPFQAYYPQFREVIVHGQVKWEHVLAFELVYGLLFLSGESFWRGYIVFGLEPHFGRSGILVMVVPYVMSHYEKPFLETMGAIVTGCVLGWLALRHRNFWLGVVIHWSVAILMDMLALYHLGVEIV